MSLFNINELVLKVSRSFDPERLRLSEWTPFLNVLCDGRKYQREAIETSLIYLFGGRYDGIGKLVRENFDKNEEMARRYNGSLVEYERKIHFPKQLSGTLDLATGTGKSFVMYGIAQIALAAGFVDRVLVLCPSLTIKAGLSEKFEALASNASLLGAMPPNRHFNNPRIINADKTIKIGDICVSNIHAVYSNNSSSIFDSLGFGKGERCLVLSDEVHHAYNKVEGRDVESKGLKEWTKFLLDPAFAFKYILGFTGTAYIENEYFNDVIFRYSLRDAIDEGFVKRVNYVEKDDSTSENAKFQKIYQTHQQAKKDYPLIRPLTILITRDIKEAKRLHTRLCEFLAERPGEGKLETVAKRKVLVVTSDNEHKSSVLRLRKIDSGDETAEWIISVAMLTEGWDVKDVFQIVPMEEKAFNSKLLIAQVLGRGLRLPPLYPKAIVKVFNHHKFSASISALVREILEIEQRLRSSPLVEGEREKLHFDMWNFDYSRDSVVVPAKVSTESVIDLTGTIPLLSETFEYKAETIFVDIDGERVPYEFTLEKENTKVSEIVDRIIREFELRDWEGKALKLRDSHYTKNNLPPRTVLEELIHKSMTERGIEGDALGNKNRNLIYAAFSSLFPRSEKTVNYPRKANALFAVSTRDRERDSVSFSSLSQNSSIFFTSDYGSEIVEEDTRAYFNVAKGVRSYKGAFEPIDNAFLFKTPIDLVFTSHEPERKFVTALCEEQNALTIDAWVKSSNKSFFSIPYFLDAGDGRFTSQQTFNPDFFIKLTRKDSEYIVCVETKSDGDDSIENKAKQRYARSHFAELNVQLKDRGINQEYIFHFLSPSDFGTFFDYLRDDRLVERKFFGSLEALLDVQ